jgi:hypothetical protein
MVGAADYKANGGMNKLSDQWQTPQAQYRT